MRGSTYCGVRAGDRGVERYRVPRRRLECAHKAVALARVSYPRVTRPQPSNHPEKAAVNETAEAINETPGSSARSSASGKATGRGRPD